MVTNAQRLAAGGLPIIEPTDGELLNQFAQHDDAAALAMVVDRHANMVWTVCSRILVQPADAEDVFQATMLILARKASSIRANDSAGGWLFQVAYHTALQAKRRRKSRRETELVDSPPVPEREFPDIERRQTIAILIEELRDLPAKYQTPLVLRYLEGHSRRQIAEATDASVAKVAGLLVRGKRMLRLRLARRGVSLAVAMAAVTGTAQAADASGARVIPPTPPPFDPGLAAGSVSATVSALVIQGVRTMLVASLLKPAAIGGVSVVVAGLLLLEANSTAAPVADAGGSGEAVVLEATVTEERAAESAAIAIAAPAEKAAAAKPLLASKIIAKDGQTATIQSESAGKKTQLTVTPKIDGNTVELESQLKAQLEAQLEAEVEARRRAAVWQQEVKMIDAPQAGDGFSTQIDTKQVQAEKRRVDTARQHWANRAKAEQHVDLSQPSFAELFAMRTFWSAKKKALQDKMKQLQRGRSAGAVRAGQVADAHSEIYQAKAKQLEIERLMKQAALRETSPRPTNEPSNFRSPFQNNNSNPTRPTRLPVRVTSPTAVRLTNRLPAATDSSKTTVEAVASDQIERAVSSPPADVAAGVPSNELRGRSAVADANKKGEADATPLKAGDKLLIERERPFGGTFASVWYGPSRVVAQFSRVVEKDRYIGVQVEFYNEQQQLESRLLKVENTIGMTLAEVEESLTEQLKKHSDFIKFVVRRAE